MDKDIIPSAAPDSEEQTILPRRKTALAFEVADSAEDASSEQKAPSDSPDIPPTPSEEALSTDSEGNTPAVKNAKKADKPSTDIPEEFSIPDSFLESERNSHFTGFEDSFRIRTTYVPKFTEVSENYRMSQAAVKPISVERKDDRPEQKNPAAEPSLAPTSEELEAKEVNHVVVTQSPIRQEEPKDESVRFFKFDGDDANLPPRAEEKPIEEKPLEQEAPAEQALLEEAPVQEPKKPKDPSEYTIPDPVPGVREITVEEDSADPYAPLASIDKGAKPARGEYSSPAQRDAVKDRFLDSIMAAKVRFVSVIIFLLVALAVETTPVFGLDLLAMLGIGQDWGRAVVTLILCLAATLLAIPELISALKYLAGKKLHPELYLLVSLGALVAYTAVICGQGATEYPTFASLYCLGVFATVLSGLYRAQALFRGFKVIAAKEMYKTVIDKRLTRELPRENLALDGAVDEYRSMTARTFRANFISDYFTRSNISAESSSDTALTAILGLCISVLGAIGAYFLFGGSIVDAVSCGVGLCLVSVPAVLVLSHKMAFNFAGREVESEGGAFVGESSINSISGADVITYVDTDIFGNEDVSLKKVHLYGQGENMDKAIRQMCALFGVVGGPLDYHFTASMGRKITPATDAKVEDDGISGSYDGHSIAAGTEEYMKRHGILIPGEDYRTNSQGSDSTRIMYGAEDGRVYVKFFIRYSFSEEFSMLMPYYKSRRIVALVYTADPNLNSEFMKTLTLGEDLIRVMKRTEHAEEEEPVYRRVSAEAVTLGGRASAISMLLLAKRYVPFGNKLISFCFVTMAIALLSGLALSALDAFGMLDAATHILTLVPFGIQAVALLGAYIATRRSFRPHREDNN